MKTLIYMAGHNHGQFSFCGILTVLWDSPLLCFEMVYDKSPITDVGEIYMNYEGHLSLLEYHYSL